MKFYKCFFILSLLGTVFVFRNNMLAENFLASRTKRGRSPGQLKQDIMQSLANILQQECKLIELQSRIQQELCKNISGLAESSKESSLASSNRYQLQESLDKLSEIEYKNNQIINDTMGTLSFMHSGCIEKQNVKKQNIKEVAR